jgi:pyruvate, orthophosphate dikinase
MTTQFVYSFSEGSKELKDLLGGKGANLAEMMRIGIPVPPGFTITTDACKEFLALGVAPLKMKCRSDLAIRRTRYLSVFVQVQNFPCLE